MEFDPIMSIQDAEKQAHLARIRRLEAVSFRSFPSSTTHYDGSWAIRLTSGHPAKRLNSVNPLDPRDNSEMAERLQHARNRFQSFGRPLIFRQSPLAPSELDVHLDREGWVRIEESIVMVANLDHVSFADAGQCEPVSDIGTWVDCFLELSEDEKTNKPGLVEVISNIAPNSGLFVSKRDDQPVSVLRCVQDNDLAGIFDVATGKAFKKRGFANALMKSALQWAKFSGARHAWLQVVADNEPALRLYEAFGFQELYRYSYRIQSVPE
jgi:ribosomal protein S18 acetylase RimI-like enzyme